MSNGNHCGCGSTPVPPGNQLIVPPGTLVVQQPCATTSPQSVGVAPSAFNSGQAVNNPTGECSPFAMPTVARSFVPASTNQTGNFFSNCASQWGLPGMLIYFPGQGQLEILGTNQNSVTYRNRTVVPGVEILEGTRFAVGIPMAPIEVVDTGDDDAATPVPTETIYADASQLSNLRGVLNNTPSRIVPVKNNVLVGRGGGEAGLYWVRRQLGQMRYPVTPVSLYTTGYVAAANRTATPTLPGKPVLPSEVDTFGVELLFYVAANREANDPQSCGVTLLAGGLVVGSAYSNYRLTPDVASAVINLPKEATTLPLSIVHAPNSSGKMDVRVTLLAYHY